MAKRLVINADDFGLSEKVNRDIITCYKKGAVTDISIMATGDCFKNAVKIARQNNINKIGVHLTLTGVFRAVSAAEDISTLVNEKGKFPTNYLGFLAKFFTRRINSNEIYSEFKNQISRVKKEGFRITHLDTHQHIHAVPGILKIMVRLMKEENIGYVRFPLERLDSFARFADIRAWARYFLLSLMCRLSLPILSRAGVKHNDFFLGHGRALRLRKKDLVLAISNMKNGLTELGCHPGRREEELDALCDRSFIGELKTRSIELVSY